MEKNIELKEFENMNLLDGENVVSANECTGLIPAQPDSKKKEEAIKSIYDLP